MHLERCIPDVWYWRWLLILVDFAGILFFFDCLLTTKYRRVSIFMVDWVVLPTVSFCEYLFAREKNGT